MAAKTQAPATTPTEQLIAAVVEQTGWLRAIAMPQVRQTVEQALTKTAMRTAYEASDGTRTIREVATVSGASIGAISGWLARWRALGIGVEQPGGRTAHLISLKDLGLPLDVKED